MPAIQPVLDAHRVTGSGDGGDQVVAVAGKAHVVLANTRFEQHSAGVVGNGVLPIADAEAIGVVAAKILELVVASPAVERVVLITAYDGIISIGGCQSARGQLGTIPHRTVSKA